MIAVLCVRRDAFETRFFTFGYPFPNARVDGESAASRVRSRVGGDPTLSGGNILVKLAYMVAGHRLQKYVLDLNGALNVVARFSLATT
jgi:hypothetical protein